MDPDRLRAIPVFASLDDRTLRGIATFATESSVPAGEHVVREGDYGYDLMAIEEGEADVIRGGETIATLGPGDFFGEMAVLEKTLRTASVVAKTPMRLVTLSHWDLKRTGDAIDQIRATLEERKRMS
jgi:CRP/FNR family cyclic AMP-dependent transcriptional regulator